MAKDIILTANELAAPINVSSEAIEAYRFALQLAGTEMDDEQKADFITRRNAKSGWRDLMELKATLEMYAASIETVVKHTMNVDSSAALPAGFSWKDNGKTYAIAEGAMPIIIDTILKKNKLLKKDDFFAALDVSKLAKVSGIKADQLQEMFPDTITSKEKAKSLLVK